MRSKAKTLSPYQRYGKRPHRYSKEYQNWHHCVKNRDEAGAKAHDQNWQRLYGIRASLRLGPINGGGHVESVRSDPPARQFEPSSASKLRRATIRKPEVRVR